jgi:hypothetical protein
MGVPERGGGLTHLPRLAAGNSASHPFDRPFPLLKQHANGDFDITKFDKDDMVIVGTSEEWLAKFLKYEDADVDQVLCYVNFGRLNYEAVLESITLLGDYVIPELKKAGAHRTARNLEQSLALQAAK